ncbi:MAG TPA: TatD family hydrolase [Candidatus Saccharicenans sp.]|jgi:TatD DNase family protein|nr:TatD family hydrolase [Candidatus Saccharicenans sp.]HRD02609.1 TatD family hydrolase [Candidatus Saccharicenans sp.]
MPEEALVLVDSHAHLDLRDFNDDRNEVVQRACKNGVKYILCPLDVSSRESLNQGFKLKEERNNIYLAAGLHPHDARKLAPGHLVQIRKMAAAGEIVAIGEIGLDFHYNFSPPDKQIEAFSQQLELASELKLPVIIHSREAAQKIIEIIKSLPYLRGGILHCFSESWPLAKTMINLGFFVSFSGILTYERATDVQEAARRLPLDVLLVETDSPYLTPYPEKKTNKRNEPAFVVTTARKLASLKNISISQVAEASTENFFRFLRLKNTSLDVKI